MRAESAMSMMNCRSSSWSFGDGGMVKWTTQDVAAALAGCPPGPYYIALYKYAGDPLALDPLVQSIMVAIGKQEDRRLIRTDDRHALTDYFNNWSGKTPNDSDIGFCHTLHRLAHVLVDDCVSEHRHSVCHGSGVYQYRTCRGCGGTGRKCRSVSEMARLLRISSCVWSKQWRSIYQRAEAMMVAWEQSIIVYINRRLGT